MASALSPCVYTNILKKIFVHESREAAEDFLQKNNLTLDSTPLLIPFRIEGDIQFLKPSDKKGGKDGCIRIMGAANILKDKTVKGNIIADWFNTILKKDKYFAPHLNDLEGENILLEEDGLIIVYQRAAKNQGPKKVGTVFAKFFRKEKEELRKEIDRSSSNDEVKTNTGRLTQGLSDLGMDLGIIAGMSYFIKDGEVFRHTFKEGKSNRQIRLYLQAEKKAQAMRMLYNKTENNHVLPFLKNWAKGTVFAAITAVGAGVIASIFLIAVLAAVIAVTTFVILSVIAYCKASKDNETTRDFGITELEVIEEASKQKKSILNTLKLDLLMVLAYFRGKSSEAKQAVNQVVQPTQNEIAPDQPSVMPIKSEMAALQSPLTEPAKLTPVEQNPIPRVMPVHATKEQSFVPVMKVTPTCATESSKQPVKNSWFSLFRIKEFTKKIAIKEETKEKIVKAIESGLKYQGCTIPYI